MSFDHLSRLTPKNKEVLGHLVTGSSNKDIAAALHIDCQTVKQHLSKMYRITGARKREELVLLALDAVVPEQIVHPKLTSNPRLALVAKYVALGYTNAEIAEMAGTTDQTIKNYNKTLYDIFGVWSRLELAIMLAVPRRSHVYEGPVRVEGSCGREEIDHHRPVEQEAPGSGGISSVSV